MRALVVTNMYPTAARPALGSFVRDQVEALRALPDLDLELFAFPPGGAGAYLRGAAELARRYRRTRFDIVHAHFGLTIVPSRAARARAHAVTLHGTDLAHPRSRKVTLASLRWVDLVAVPSAALAAELPPDLAHRRAVLPAGVATDRFGPIDRQEARAKLGLSPDRAYLLFPSSPDRLEKRFDRAQALAGDTELLTLRDVPPDQVSWWMNAANAVLVPSEREGFGLAVLEALACEVPVLATPVGIHPEVLDGLPGTLCAPFDAGTWSAALAPHLADPDPPRLAGGRARAERYSAAAMATRVLDAWRELLGP